MKTICAECGASCDFEDDDNVSCCAMEVNANCFVDGLGVLPLAGHAGPDRSLCFCSAVCAAHFVEAHPEVLHWVAKADMRPEIYGSCAWCDKDEKKGFPGPFVAIASGYNSFWDSLNAPHYFCSLRCLVAALKKDAAEMRKDGLGKWYAGPGQKNRLELDEG